MLGMLEFSFNNEQWQTVRNMLAPSGGGVGGATSAESCLCGQGLPGILGRNRPGWGRRKGGDAGSRPWGECVVVGLAKGAPTGLGSESPGFLHLVRDLTHPWEGEAGISVREGGSRSRQRGRPRAAPKPEPPELSPVRGGPSMDAPARHPPGASDFAAEGDPLGRLIPEAILPPALWDLGVGVPFIPEGGLGTESWHPPLPSPKSGAELGRL